MRRRPLRVWIALALVAGAVGFALDKGFADNTPPYHEPLISSLGLALWLACAAAIVVLCGVAAVRFVRGR